MTSTTTQHDIVDLLTNDHHEAALLLNRFADTSADERPAYLCEVVQALVAHEVAEEAVVYPAIRRDAPNGANEADARLEEQANAEVALAALEGMDPQSAEFSDTFLSLRSDVLAHAAAEEEHIFPLLREAEDAASRYSLGARYEQAKLAAPTHPHPHAPDTPPGNLVLGPIAALFDRARDAVTSSER